MENNVRIIGIRHRIKQTAADEARPTQVTILDQDQVTTYDLATEDDELDFVRNRYPVQFRKPEQDENLSDFNPRHVHWRKLKDQELVPSNLIKTEGKTTYVVSRVPVEHDGMRDGDLVAMVLGGSGDNLAFALSRKAETIDASVWRIPSFLLKDHRELDKNEDSMNLAQLAKTKLNMFYPTTPRDRTIISIRETFRARIEAMKERIACQQRLRQHLVGNIFRSEEGLFPEGEIEQMFDDAKANDPIFQALHKEERRRLTEMEKALEQFNVYQKLFTQVDGMGPAIAARIIAAVMDVRRFKTSAKFKKFCGVHVMEDGRFPRKRAGQVANWQPSARQGLYLLGDQFNKRPDSVWGKKLREYKIKFRTKYPEPVLGANGKMRYTDRHIHKMATWRTITKFTEWLWREWSRIEREHQAGPNKSMAA